MTLTNRKTFLSLTAGIAVYLCSFLSVTAQVHTPHLPENRWIVLAEEQYQQGHYTVAKQSAENFLSEHSDPLYKKNAQDVDKARYYLALSSLMLNEPGSVVAVVNTMSATSDPAYRSRIAYALGGHYFRLNDFSSAITYYEVAGIGNLSNKEVIDEKFELAYCYFNTKQFDKAEPLLSSIKELTQGKYFIAGNYYYGLLAYDQSKYADALTSFDRIKDEPQYRTIVPYYIAEIYYFTGNKNKALELAVSLTRQPEKLYYDNELHLLAAQCLFEEEKYTDAVPYFEYYYDHVDKIRKEELYELAYCYYKTKKWNSAIEKFKLLSNTRDSLAQSAMYLLGDCYLKEGDKQSARNAFGISADMPYNRGQQEASMILNADLSYEMGYNDEALQQLNNMLTSYPNSKYKDEAKTISSDLLIKTSNYAEALRRMDEVTNRIASFWPVYQKVTFGYAIQQFQASNYAAADSFFALSVQHPADANYTANAYFWLGELAYRLHHFDKTISYSQSYLDAKTNTVIAQRLSPGATPQHAYMNMGYAAMEQNNYTTAQTYFSRATQLPGEDSATGITAVLQEADAWFMQKNYAKALALYDRVAAANTADADYARFQKSILYGLQGKNSDKVKILQGLIDKTPPSAYAGNARYELAVTYIEQSKYQAAITMLLPLTDGFNGRNFSPKAWIKIGFSYQQLDNDTKAIDAYKKVITDYPASEEKTAALDALKNLYIENNDPSGYAKLLKDNNIPVQGLGGIDSTYYAAAESQFAAGKWDNARQAMSKYLSQYPTGTFINKAHYYKAESNYQLKNYDMALPDYDTVLQAPWNDFSENSARRAAYITLHDKNYPAAAKYYKMLRNTAMGQGNLQIAYTGMMMSSFSTDQYSDASAYADTLIAFPGISADARQDALLYKAKSLQQLNKTDEALPVYMQLDSSKNTETAAESRYHVAEIYLQQEKLKEAENAANESIRRSAGNDYWIVKSYILLSDVLVKEKDYFNAAATLQSIVKHTKIPELKQEATKKLDAVKELEKTKSKLSE